MYIGGFGSADTERSLLLQTCTLIPVPETAGSKRDEAAVAADGGRGIPERPGVMMFV